MTLKTRIAEVRALANVKVPYSPDAIPNCHGENFKPAVDIINELTDKLDIARRALKEIATGKNEIGEKVDFFEHIAQQALKLTDIGYPTEKERHEWAKEQALQLMDNIKFPVADEQPKQE